jgi:Trk K+ transport system NAD-binding subunit
VRPGQPTPVVVLAGLTPLGLAIAERLAAAGADVHAIVSPADAAAAVPELERLGARVIAGSPRSVRALEAAGVGMASALVLAADDDTDNVDAALLIRRLRPDLPLVVRVFDPDLTAYLRDTLDRVTVLSMSSLGAPVFAEMALRALAERPEAAPSAAVRLHGPGWAAPGVDRVLAGVLVGLVVLVALATVFFAHALGLRHLDALYFVWTTVTTVGYGDIALREASDVAKLVGMVVMFAGAAFIAALHALYTGRIVSRRLEAVLGRIPVRGRHHFVVAGAGNVGFRVTGLLAERGHRVVLVERDGQSRHVSGLRAAGHHVIVADASVDETLGLARVDTACAVLALTDADGTNLHVALAVRRRAPGVPVVVRLTSPELSAHVTARGDALAASSVAIAAEAFARAALTAAEPPPEPPPTPGPPATDVPPRPAARPGRARPA